MSMLSEMAGDGGPLFVQFTTSLLIAIEGEVIKVEVKWLATHVMWLTIRMAFKAILMVTHNTSLMRISKMSNIASKLPVIGLELAIDPPPPPGGILYTMIFWNYII